MTEFNFLEADPRSLSKNRRSDPVIAEFAYALRANPNQWGQYPHTPTTPNAARSLAWRINSMHPRSPAPLRDGSFEATAQKGELYVRWIGGSK